MATHDAAHVLHRLQLFRQTCVGAFSEVAAPTAANGDVAPDTRHPPRQNAAVARFSA